MTEHDLLLTNVRALLPGAADPVSTTVAVRDGRITAIGAPADEPAACRIDLGGRLLFPGVVDAHQHWGIYNPLEADADSESRACLQGGVTTAVSYMRTGQYYLNRGGSYLDFFPSVLAACEGRAHCDYAFHLAPMSRQHIEEIPELIERFGVTSFKIFMFYGSHGLHGRSSSQSDFLMIPEDERYDLAHFEFVMRGIQEARRARPDLAEAISLSLHCETAEIMTAYTRIVEGDPTRTGLPAYSDSRPPHSEGLAVTIASYLAHETELPTINLLHLTSRKAMDAALRMRATFDEVAFRREVTIAHLMASCDTATGVAGKVNPPLRPEDDVEALWEAVLAGDVDWVCSDHACCRDETKFGEPRDDVFLAKSGFGGTEYLLPALVSEGTRRGLPLGRIAELTATNPAARFGLATKGAIEVGRDADFAVVDDASPWTIRAEDSFSSQEYSPLEGVHLTAKVTDTFLRGRHVLADGAVQDAPQGRYLRRPTAVTAG